MVPAITAADIMTTAVETIKTDWTLKQASIYLEKSGHTGAPVVAGDGKLAGILTLRDIMKGRQTGRMGNPLSGFMVRSPGPHPGHSHP
jgi:tRNA nucleotidyltransferase (CCA-adding enzyme)